MRLLRISRRRRWLSILLGVKHLTGHMSSRRRWRRRKCGQGSMCRQHRHAIGGLRRHCHRPVSYRREVSSGLRPELSEGDGGSLADVGLGLDEQREKQWKLGG